MKGTAPEPGMVPPLVLVTLEPGAVGRLRTGMLPVPPVVELVVLVGPNVLVVAVVVPVVLVVVPVELVGWVMVTVPMLPLVGLSVVVVLVLLEPAVLETLLVAAPVVVPVVGVLVLPTPVFPCADTDPTVVTPTDIPWSAMFGASRLFAARAVICNGVRVAVVPEDPEDVVWTGVPTVMLAAAELAGRATVIFPWSRRACLSL